MGVPRIIQTYAPEMSLNTLNFDIPIRHAISPRKKPIRMERSEIPIVSLIPANRIGVAFSNTTLKSIIFPTIQ